MYSMLERFNYINNQYVYPWSRCANFDLQRFSRYGSQSKFPKMVISYQWTHCFPVQWKAVDIR